MTRDYIAPILAEARDDIAKLAASIIQLADQFGGPEHWGTTPFPFGFRVNVGWTEIFTAEGESARVVIDGGLARAVDLPSVVQLFEGDDDRGFYSSIPGSVLAEIEYTPIEEFRRAIKSLEPALSVAISVAAKRKVGRGVRAGHEQDVVEALSKRLGIALPDAGLRKSVRPAVDEGVTLMEGALDRVVGSQFERNHAARQACIAHHGVDCLVCGFSFERTYGQIGAHFIHVHHLVPISSRGGEYQVDPREDLVLVCPNCHAMLHRQDPPLTLDELRRLVSGADP